MVKPTWKPPRRRTLYGPKVSARAVAARWAKRLDACRSRLALVLASFSTGKLDATVALLIESYRYRGHVQKAGAARGHLAMEVVARFNAGPQQMAWPGWSDMVQKIADELERLTKQCTKEREQELARLGRPEPRGRGESGPSLLEATAWRGGTPCYDAGESTQDGR